MELHEHLYALGQRLGRDVFDDADGLRGALDDFLDEDAATTGEINLLVDAVRLGAFRSMVTTLDSGGDVLRAVEEAAARLARDRGSADLDGARWALAALGYGVGRVSDPDVQRYRTAGSPGTTAPGGTSGTDEFDAGPPPQAVGPTVLPPPSPGPGAYHQPTPPMPQPTAQVGSQPPPSQPTAQPQFSPPQQWGPASGTDSPHAAPRRKSKALPVLAAVLAVVLVAGGVTAAVVLTGGDDDEPSVDDTTSQPVSDDTGDTGGPTEPTTSETVDPTSSDAVNQRYSGLAGVVTTGTSSCETGSPTSGESERLECAIDSGTLQLVTYDSQADLEAARKRAVSLAAGGRLEETDAGTFFAFEETDDDDNPVEAYVYWDDVDALQSGRYDASSGTDLDELVNVFSSTDATLTYPEKPSSQELIDFASQWFLTSRCERIQTLVDQELEENFCDVNGPVEVYLGRFESRKDFRNYRRITLQNAKADDRMLRTWNYQEGAPPVGAAYEYTTDSGSAVRYWDQPDCLCYAEAYLGNGSYEQLLGWWRID